MKLENMDTPQLRDQYKKFQRQAVAEAPFEYTKQDFNNDVEQLLETGSYDRTPLNWVKCAEIRFGDLIQIAEMHDEWIASKGLDEDRTMGYDTLEERAMDML